MITAVNEFMDDLRGGKMSEAPIVRVEQGELQGRVVDSPSGKTFFSFQGVPYAKPPLGSLRFKAPQPPEPWDGVRDASSEGNVSAQIDILISKDYLGDENCLFLNVYTPNLDGEFLPVMVFIHGGGFKFGSGNSSLYGADYLIEKDVVVVTINYRCGALGFLSLNTPEVPGNAGLKDMVQAIRWIKENIHKFGGNSGNITIFGESAGGAAVSILTASPLTKGLISKGIIQSGTALNSWAFQQHPVDNARKLAKELGCEAEDIDEVLDFLTATPVKDIVEANEKLHPEEYFRQGHNFFAPVVEKEFAGVEAVLTESFVDLLTSGRVADVPIMIGSTTLEFAYEKSSDDLQSFIPEELNIEVDSPESLAIAESIKRLYFKGQDDLREQFELISDKLINIDTHRYIQRLIQVSNKPVYYYKFDYVGELNITKKLMNSFGLSVAGHMDELGYLFKNDLQNDVEPTPQDEKMRERMLRLWTNFAKSGNPTPDENHILPVTWLPVTRDNLYYLNLGNELTMATDPDKEKMDFWDSLYIKYYKIWDHPQMNTEAVPRKEPEMPEVIQEAVEVIETLLDQGTAEVVQDGETAAIQIPNDAELVQEIQDIQANHLNGDDRKVRTSREIKMVQQSNGAKDVIRANDPPEDDLPKNIGVNKFVNFFESLGGKK